MKKSYLLGAVIALSAISYGALSIAHGADAAEKGPKMQYIKNAKGMMQMLARTRATSARL